MYVNLVFCQGHYVSVLYGGVNNNNLCLQVTVDNLWTINLQNQRQNLKITNIAPKASNGTLTFFPLFIYILVHMILTLIDVVGPVQTITLIDVLGPVQTSEEL